MLDNARQKIEETLKGAQSPVVLCSFGKDSLLLLKLAQEVRPDISIIWLKTHLTKEQRRFAESVILEEDLTVLGYAPVDLYYLPDKEGLTLISEYSFGHARLPVLTYTEHGEKCGLKLTSDRTEFYPYPFDVTLIGYKETDEHFVVGENPFPGDGFQLGSTRVYAPLRTMTDEEVLGAIKEIGVRYEPVDDTLRVCTACMSGKDKIFCPDLQKEIPVFEWDRQASLDAFRGRFGFKEAA